MWIRRRELNVQQAITTLQTAGPEDLRYIASALRVLNLAKETGWKLGDPNYLFVRLGALRSLTIRIDVGVVRERATENPSLELANAALANWKLLSVVNLGDPDPVASRGQYVLKKMNGDLYYA